MFFFSFYANTISPGQPALEHVAKNLKYVDTEITKCIDYSILRHCQKDSIKIEPLKSYVYPRRNKKKCFGN